jgi:hypothetical protein
MFDPTASEEQQRLLTLAALCARVAGAMREAPVVEQLRRLEAEYIEQAEGISRAIPRA